MLLNHIIFLFVTVPTKSKRCVSLRCFFNWSAVFPIPCCWMRADPSADELRRLMMLHGGQFHVYYSRSITTHIIASNLPNNKIKELKGEKVVRPAWITDRLVDSGNCRN